MGLGEETHIKKIILGVVGVLVLGIGGVFAAASGQPDSVHLERSISVAAQPGDMVAFGHDLVGVNKWSPWDEKDPNLVRAYSDSTSGVGAWYHWTGNDEVGEGKMTITAASEGSCVMDLDFIAPFESHAVAAIKWAADGEGTKVTWGFDTDTNMMLKVMMVLGVMDFETQLGRDYEKGLALLKPQVEQAAQERVAAEAAAAEAAANAAAEAAVEGEEAPAAE